MIRNIDVDLLRAFITIYETSSFSHAAKRLGRTQSTISQQIKKLEEILERGVFLRNNRSVSLTTEGEVLLPYARQIISINDEVFGRITKPDISGTVRMGVPEAFATNHLPDILVQFAQSHPCVALEVHCDLTHNIIEKFEKGDFDLALIKQDKKTKIYGKRIWRENLVWAGLSEKPFHLGGALPLILSPYPCIYRTKTLEALEKKNIKWNAVFTSSNMSGRIAAAKAGLGITTIPKEMLSQAHGLSSLNQSSGLPKVSDIEIDLLQNEEIMSDASKRLAEHIIFAFEHDPSLGQAI
jgi:DNA-binding transcriptional LysR family regulator